MVLLKNSSKIIESRKLEKFRCMKQKLTLCHFKMYLIKSFKHIFHLSINYEILNAREHNTIKCYPYTILLSVDKPNPTKNSGGLLTSN